MLFRIKRTQDVKMDREEPDTTAFQLSMERLQGERSCASVYSECTLCLLSVLATRLKACEYGCLKQISRGPLEGISPVRVLEWRYNRYGEGTFFQYRM